MATLDRSRAFFRELFGSRSVQAADAVELLRARVLVGYICCTLLLTTSWALVHLGYGSPWTAGMFLLSSLCSAAVLVKLSLDRRLHSAGHLSLMIATLSVGAATLFTGGLRLTNVAPYFITIVAPFFLLGRGGLLWAVASIALPLGFELAARAGVAFPDLVPPAERPADAFLTWLSSAASVFVFAYFYEQARVLALRRLQAANQAKTQFLANISHELRTPLHAMVASSALLEDSELSAEQRALIGQARQQGKRLGELIDDLLDLSALQSGHFSIRPADFAPGDVLREVAAAIAPGCAAKGLALRCELDAALPPRVHGDGGRLLQILLNLAGNAVKFTARGEVVLRAAPAASRASSLGCLFTVSDTGLGISPSDRQRIFDSFTQLDGSLARPQEGAGLGLYIARQLALCMGGSIDVQGELGRGCSFRLELPFAAPHASAGDLEPMSAPLRVLLVDDSAVNQDLARHMLIRLGHQVLLASSGDEGVRRCQAEEPDVVLMDIQMPGMDGIAAMRAIRAAERERGAAPVPLLAMSGHHAQQHRDAYQELSVASALVRPFDRADLEDALRRVRPASASPQRP
ncbi:MAG: ATP-binding protein [Pseudomonadota bacterium]